MITIPTWYFYILHFALGVALAHIFLEIRKCLKSH